MKEECRKKQRMQERVVSSVTKRIWRNSKMLLLTIYSSLSLLLVMYLV